MSKKALGSVYMCVCVCVRDSYERRNTQCKREEEKRKKRDDSFYLNVLDIRSDSLF